jgi:uncharacterized membrane protein YdfJ with MMPL/SSD domain
MINLAVANILGFIYYHRRAIVLAIAAIAIIVGSVLAFRSCGRREPKLNQAEIQAAQRAIAEQDREQMLYILAESEAREAAADKDLDEAKKAATEAVMQVNREWSNKSNEEIAAELERRAKQ